MTIAVIKRARGVVIKSGVNSAEVRRQAELAKDEADRSETEADRAETERLGSESARDAAIAYLNPYVSQAAGEAATSEGEPFSFLDANDEVALAVRTAGGSELLPTYFDVSKVSGAGRTVATRTVMKALTSLKDRSRPVYLTEGVPSLCCRAGTFIWDATVPISTHQADTAEAVYVAPVAGSNGAWVRQFTGPINAGWAGAVGDDLDTSMAANTAALNAAGVICSRLGAGEVRIPPGAFRTNNNIKTPDNVIFRGSGRGVTYVKNRVTSGFARCVFTTGNLGDITNANGFFSETEFNLEAITRGDTVVELSTPADAANFTVGRPVGITSYERWTGASPANFQKLQNFNVVKAIDGAFIHLKYPVRDSYSTVSGNPTIRRFSGSINGYDGQPLWASQNCGVCDMSISQNVGQSSGWYAIFACGVAQTFENLDMDSVSTLFGSNGLSHSTLRNIDGLYEGGSMDFADWQNDNTFEDITTARFSVNSALEAAGALLGVSVHGGTDVTMRRVTAAMGGHGRASMFKVYRGSFEDCTFSDPGFNEVILLGYADSCRAIGSRAFEAKMHGITLAGDAHVVERCDIPSAGSGGFSVFAVETVLTGYIRNNRFGIEGAETTRDRFYQNVARQPGVKTSGNTGYIEHRARLGSVVNADFVETSATSWATLKSTTLKGTTGIARKVRISASGPIAGSSFTKDVRITHEGVTLATIPYAVGQTGNWRFEITLYVTTGNAVRCSIQAWRSTTKVIEFSGTVSGVSLTSDAVIALQGQVGGGSEKVQNFNFEVEATS